MFTAFFLAAFVGGFLTSRLKEKESALTLRERAWPFYNSFARPFPGFAASRMSSRSQKDSSSNILKLRSTVFLRGADGKLDFSYRPERRQWGGIPAWTQTWRTAVSRRKRESPTGYQALPAPRNRRNRAWGSLRGRRGRADYPRGDPGTRWRPWPKHDPGAGAGNPGR